MQICMLYAHSEVLTYTQAKYDEMTQKERDIAQKSDAEQIQEIMADVMKGGGPMTLQKHMADPESREMLMTLTKLLQNAGMVPPGASR